MGRLGAASHCVCGKCTDWFFCVLACPRAQVTITSCGKTGRVPCGCTVAQKRHDEATPSRC